jgi:heat shock protein HslJ
MTSRRLDLLAAAATLLFAAVALSACSGPGSEVDREGRPATLAGTSWRVVSVGGRPPIGLAVPTASFTADRVTGSGSCNVYSGGYRYDPASGRIELGDLGATAMACLEAPRNEFERAYFQALGRASLVAIDAKGRMQLSGPGGVVILEVDPQRAVEG